MLKHTISQKESAFGANSGPEAPHSNFMPPLRPLTEHRTQGAGATGSSIQNREGRVFYLFLLPGRCVLSFARKPTGCCPVADLPRNACLDTRKHGMTGFASYCCRLLPSPSRTERRGHRLGRPDRSERLSPFPPEASSTLWRVWSAISSRASSVSRWSLKIAAVREQRSPPPLSQSQILMDIPS
jgi:hypothetical protein